MSADKGTFGAANMELFDEESAKYVYHVLDEEGPLPRQHHHHLPTNQNHRTACSLRFALCLAWPIISVMGLQIVKDQPIGSCYSTETESICPRMGESKAAN
jgi:hypothetical protein